MTWQHPDGYMVVKQYDLEISFLVITVQNLINLPGHNQSPVGILAFTSTRPYLNEKELTVRIRAAIAGLMVLPPPREQP